MARVMIRLGDVFAAKLDDKTKKYFQYVADDMSQLNSRVIRVFKKGYPIDVSPDLQEIVSGEIGFHAHVVIRWGIQMNLWKKVGKVKEVGSVDVLFRGTGDSGRRIDEPPVEISKKWYVWKINESFRDVGRLKGKNQKAEIGIIVTPEDIVHRMRTGEYDFVYPGY